MSCFQSFQTWFYNLLHTPLTTKKLMIGGGVIIVIIVIIVLAATLSASGGGQTPNKPGHYAIMDSPLVVGSNNFAQLLKSKVMNQISNLNFMDPTKWDCPECQTDLKRLGHGFVASQIWSVGSSNCNASQLKDAVTQSLEQIDVMLRMISLNGKQLQLYKRSDDVREAKKKSMVSCLLSISGGHNLDGRPSILRMYYDLGVRAVSLVSNCSTPWASSANAKNDTGMNDFGKKLVSEMNRLGVVIDLTTSSAKTRAEVLQTSKAPVIFSRSNSANLTAHPYNLDDVTLDLVKKHKSLVMVSFVDSQLMIGTNTNVTRNDVINHMEFLKKKVGVDLIGIGGGFDLEEGKLATGLEDVSKFSDLFDILHDKGWSLEDLKKVAGLNFEDILRQVEKVANDMKTVTPLEEYEPLADFTADENLTCYSDQEMRYKDNPTTTTTVSTTEKTPTTTVSTTTTTTTNATAPKKAP